MATLSSRDWREPKMIAIKIIGKLDAKRHSTTDIYDIEGELGTTMGRDHCEPKKIAIDIVGTLDPKRHSQMDILGAGGVSQTVDTLKETKKVAIELSLSEILTIRTWDEWQLLFFGWGKSHTDNK